MRVALLKSNKVVGCAVVLPEHYNDCIPEWEAHDYSIVILDENTRTPSPGATYDGSVFTEPPTPSLDDVKLYAFQELDRIKAAAYANGFTYQGAQFSLLPDAQVLSTRLYTVKDTPEMLATYPLYWPHIGGSGFLALTSPSDVSDFFIAQSFALRAINEKDAAKRLQISLATTIEQVYTVLQDI